MKKQKIGEKLLDKSVFFCLYWRKSYKESDEETSTLRNVPERDPMWWKDFVRKQPKTSSERPQSGPVIPLSS